MQVDTRHKGPYAPCQHGGNYNCWIQRGPMIIDPTRDDVGPPTLVSRTLWYPVQVNAAPDTLRECMAPYRYASSKRAAIPPDLVMTGKMTGGGLHSVAWASAITLYSTSVIALYVPTRNLFTICPALEPPLLVRWRPALTPPPCNTYHPRSASHSACLQR